MSDVVCQYCGGSVTLEVDFQLATTRLYAECTQCNEAGWVGEGR